MFGLKIHRIFVSIIILFSLTIYPAPHVFIEVFSEKEVNHTCESKSNKTLSRQEKLPVYTNKPLKLVSRKHFLRSVTPASHLSLPLSSSVSPISLFIISTSKLIL
jgi:hypothetical protein